jgi:hypothetical protein
VIRFFTIVALFLLVPFAPLPAKATPTQRPATGSGLLTIKPLTPQRTTDIANLAIYRAPGVERIRNVNAAELPGLTPVMSPRPGEYLQAVTGKKGNWLRIAYDDAGREGWLEMARYWEYTPWEKFFPGQTIRLLAGLKRSCYSLRVHAGDAASQLSALTGKTPLRVMQTNGDWLMVTIDRNVSGWIRWRDSDGRFLISVDAS